MGEILRDIAAAKSPGQAVREVEIRLLLERLRLSEQIPREDKHSEKGEKRK